MRGHNFPEKSQGKALLSGICSDFQYLSSRRTDSGPLTAFIKIKINYKNPRLLDDKNK